MKIKSDNTARNTLRKRETLLLVAVIAGALIAVVYMMVYTPLQEDKEELQNQIQTLDAEHSAKTARVKLLPDLQAQLQLAQQGGVELYNYFYGMVDQEEFIFMLYRHAQDSGIQLDRVAFESEKMDLSEAFTAQSEKESTDASPETETEADGEGTATRMEEIRAAYFGTLKMTALSLDISGEYEQCIQFLNLLHINEKKIAVVEVLLESQASEEDPADTDLPPVPGADAMAPTTPVRGVISLVIFHVPEAETLHAAREERRALGGEWIVGAADPFDAAVIAPLQPKETAPPLQP